MTTARRIVHCHGLQAPACPILVRALDLPICWLAPGDEAKIGFKVHPHLLRHACSYALANKGLETRTLQAYRRHRTINSTTRYAALAPGGFKNIWGKA